MLPSVIKLEDVSYDYPLKGSSFRALSNVSLNISQGEYVAVIGASGSGKTTLMNIIGLMTPPTLGLLEFEGKNVGNIESDILAKFRGEKIGFVFQSFNLLSKLSIIDNVLLPSQYINSNIDAEARALDLLKLFDITEQAYKIPASLSGGQKQRAALARALFISPVLLLADEPTGALDSHTTQVVLDIFDKLNSMGHTLVVITHNPDVAMRAKRIIEISDGKIIDDHINKQYLMQKTSENIDYIKVKRELEVKEHNKFIGYIQNLSITFKHYTSIVFNTMITNAVRSILTICGLAVGIVAIIVMISLTSETRKAFDRFIGNVGANRAVVMFDMREADRTGQRRWRGLDMRVEYAKVADMFSKFGDIDPIIDAGSCTIRSATETGAANLSGLMSHSSFVSLDTTIKQGRTLTLDEYKNPANAPIVLLGAAAADKLFPKTDGGYAARENYPVGEYIHISGCSLVASFKVVGILNKMDSDFSADNNEAVFAPSLMLTSRGVRNYATFFVLNPKANVLASDFAKSFTNYLTLRTYNKYPFRFFTAESQIKNIQIMLTIMSGITILIGGLCIIIGGIGVMNIMLVSITERIKEIGIRKAVGARSYHIRNQFLIESILFCFLGGILGIVIGVAISNAATYVASMFLPKYVLFSFSVNITALIAALLVSFVSGIVFGMIPAKRAALLDVVTALRAD